MAAAAAPAAVGGLEGNKQWMEAEVRGLLLLGCPALRERQNLGSSLAHARCHLPPCMSPHAALLVLLLLDPPVYQSSTSLQDVKLVGALVAEGQAHLFADWPAPGEQDDDKRRLLAQLRHLDKSYAGGLGSAVWVGSWMARAVRSLAACNLDRSYVGVGEMKLWEMIKQLLDAGAILAAWAAEGHAFFQLICCCCSSDACVLLSTTCRRAGQVHPQRSAAAQRLKGGCAPGLAGCCTLFEEAAGCLVWCYTMRLVG